MYHRIPDDHAASDRFDHQQEQRSFVAVAEFHTLFERRTHPGVAFENYGNRRSEPTDECCDHHHTDYCHGIVVSGEMRPARYSVSSELKKAHSKQAEQV